MHLMSGEKGKLEEIGKRITEANNKSTALHRELDAIFTATLHDIAARRDPISIQLAPIFEKAVKPSLGDAGRARSRKERGNPPGKRTDPLGDQLTWEQFLSAIKGEPLVWIITGDGDYRYEMPDKQLVLNPILLNDVLAGHGDKNRGSLLQYAGRWVEGRLGYTEAAARQEAVPRRDRSDPGRRTGKRQESTRSYRNLPCVRCGDNVA
jgi:hypothetical protein